MSIEAFFGSRCTKLSRHMDLIAAAQRAIGLEAEARRKRRPLVALHTCLKAQRDRSAAKRSESVRGKRLRAQVAHHNQNVAKREDSKIAGFLKLNLYLARHCVS